MHTASIPCEVPPGVTIGDRYVNIKELGAVGDGVHDDTCYFERAIFELSTLFNDDKARLNSLGIINDVPQFGHIYIPRGRYRITKHLRFYATKMGIKFTGDSAHASVLIFESDSDEALMEFISYNTITFEDLSFVHESTLSRDCWKTSLFRFNGKNGGRNFTMNRCFTRNFNIILDFVDGKELVQDQVNTDRTLYVNEDTNTCYKCTFEGCNIFLKSFNSQAVLNNYDSCTWGGKIEKVFYVAGHGRTQVNEGNIVIDGTVLHFEGDRTQLSSNIYSDSTVWLFRNTKLEWTEAHKAPDPGQASNPTPKLLYACGDTIVGRITFDNCGLSGGLSKADPKALLCVNRTGGLKIDFIAGNYEGIMKIGRVNGNHTASGSYMRFRDTTLQQGIGQWLFSHNINQDADGNYDWANCTHGLTDTVDATNENPFILGSQNFPNICFENTRMDTVINPDLPPVNLTWVKNGTPFLNPTREVVIGMPKNEGTVTADKCIEYPFYQQRVLVERIGIIIEKNYFNPGPSAGSVNPRINIYDNKAKSGPPVAFHNFTTPTEDNTFDPIAIVISSPFIAHEGLFFDIKVPPGARFGFRLLLKYTSV